MRLLVGLGNPGRQYVHSRHNVGFRCLDVVAQRLASTFSRRAANAVLATAKVAGVKVLLAKPQTLMNFSGEAVGRLVHYYGLSLERLLVIYDDMDLPLGRIRIREGGSSGGHRGMQSIIETLATDAFPRMRLGIGRSAAVGGARYVLGRFAVEEEAPLAEVLTRAADAVEAILAEGVAVAMNRYNA